MMSDELRAIYNKALMISLIEMQEEPLRYVVTTYFARGETVGFALRVEAFEARRKEVSGKFEALVGPTPLPPSAWSATKDLLPR